MPEHRAVEVVVLDEVGGVRTEISAKFAPDSADRMFEESGLKLLDLHTDDRGMFALALGRAG